jgi:hypothetical protein
MGFNSTFQGLMKLLVSSDISEYCLLPQEWKPRHTLVFSMLGGQRATGSAGALCAPLLRLWVQVNGQATLTERAPDTH